MTTTIVDPQDIYSFMMNVLNDAMNEKPLFGSISIKLIFHSGELKRVTSKKTESVIPITIQES